jgi:lysophospholipase L1-like esterase
VNENDTVANDNAQPNVKPKSNPQTPSTPLRNIILNGMVMLITLVLCLIIAEVALRVVHNSKIHTFELDKKLGWRTVPNLDLVIQTQDFVGTPSTVKIQTNADGFRVYDTTLNTPRVLIIGDSFTFGKDVSQESTYYSLLQRSIGGSFFVYGGEGFNTLQEFFILDEFIDQIKPDIVILQFCWNDYLANLPELEQQSLLNNNGYRRPYPNSEGNPEYSNPKGALHTFSLNYSRLLYSLLYRSDQAFGWSAPDIEIEDIIKRDGTKHQGLQGSKQRTLRVLKKFKERCGNVPTYIFPIDDLAPYYSLTQEISEVSGLEFIPGIGAALREFELTGETTKASDGAHWNAAGHRVTAEILTAWFAERLN